MILDTVISIQCSRVLVCGPDWLGAHYVDKASFALTMWAKLTWPVSLGDLPASASLGRGLQTYATMSDFV